jgi:hypothetical protein
MNLEQAGDSGDGVASTSGGNTLKAALRGESSCFAARRKTSMENVTSGWSEESDHVGWALA